MNAKSFALLLALVGPIMMRAQVTTIEVNNTVLQSPVKRFGINLGATNYYDSSQMLKNLIVNNPGFEGEIAQSIIQCSAGTATSCTHANAYSGWANDFWDGATYQFVYGTALGRSGTVSSYVAANGTTGGVFTFSDSGTVPGGTDFMIVRKPMPGNAADGWQVNYGGNGTVTTNSTDLPPGTTGLQTAYFKAPTSSDSATITAYFDSTANHTFLQLNGEYQLTFKAKGLGANPAVAVDLLRNTNPQVVYINSTINLTDQWQTYTLTFNGTENGSAIGTAQLQFYTVGADSFYLDDVSLVQMNTDPTNTTIFRDPVVNALRQLSPGTIRFWFNQLGESLDNMLAPPLGRQRSTYSAYTTDVNFVEYGLTDFLQLCQAVGADPWVVIPITLSDAEASNLIDYLAGPTSTVYGAKRAAAGQTAPWTSVFHTIHLEFGNEAWDEIFNGGDMESPPAYGTRTQAVFADMRNNPSFTASSFDLIMNGLAGYAPYSAEEQAYCNNNDSMAAAPYMMYTVNDPAASGYTGAAANEDLFGSAFAEAEAFVTASGTAEGVANGYVLQDQLASAPRPFSTTEFNISPRQGTITQSELNGFSSSIGGGLSVVDGMLQQLRAGVLTQNLFQLAQYDYFLPDGNSVNLFGAVVDMGVTDRRRPQFLALQMANDAIGSGGATMLQTVQGGANPTWNQALVQDVQLNNVHYLQSFAFNTGNQYSLILINTNRTSALPVSFAGEDVPAGTVQMQQLTSANITDNNETSLVVAPVSSTISNFNPSTTLSLPAFSMTTLTWTGPSISAVTVSNITATSAKISWSTDVSSSGQVNYGTTASYGSQSATSVASTTQSITLTGLNPSTTYNFAVSATNAAGAKASSQNATFTTLAAFSISAPATITLQQSQGNTFPVTVTPGNGFSGSVGFSLSGLPSGASDTFLGTTTGATLVIYVSSTVPAATYPLTLSGTSGATTITAPISLVVTAVQQSQTITFNAIPAQTVGSSLTVSATASSGLPVTFSIVQNGNCSISGSVVTFLNIGNCGVIANQAGNSSYMAAPAVGQVIVVKQPSAQTITFGTIATQTVGTPLTLTATASSGLTVSYASSTMGVCTVSGNTASFVAAGTCTITASQPGNTTYAAATSVAQSFTVKAAALKVQTITFGAIAAQTVGKPLTLTATASSGLTVSYASSTTGVCKVSGSTASFVASGTCTITASQPGNTTYAAATAVSQSFTVHAESQTISFGTIAAQKVGTSLTLTATASSGLAVSYASPTTGVCKVSGSTATFVAAGTCTITASQGGNAAYAAATSVSQSFTVTASLKSQTITFNAIAAQNVGVSLTVRASASSGLPVSFSIIQNGNCSISGSVVKFLNPGDCGVIANQSGNSTYAAAPAVGQVIVVN